MERKDELIEDGALRVLAIVAYLDINKRENSSIEVRFWVL